MPHIGEELAFLSGAPAMVGVTPGASPYTYLTLDAGRAILKGGTVSLVEVGRGGTFVDVGVVAGCIPMSRGDQIRITYTVVPTMTFMKT